ncbi:MAG: hypothetical protein ABH841_02585 [Candidatus Nealsonbacteria bacterium]
MRLFLRKPNRVEKLFRLFISDLKADGFDPMVFSENQIKKNIGKGLYGLWKESLKILHHKKIILIFMEKDLRVSWPSNGCFDRLVINMARAPDIKALLRAEKELLELLAI